MFMLDKMNTNLSVRKIPKHMLFLKYRQLSSNLIKILKDRARCIAQGGARCCTEPIDWSQVAAES